MTTIIDRIKSIRKKHALSQAGFAKEIGYSQSYIKDIEVGKSRPSRNVLEAISERWDISIDWLLKGEGKHPKKTAKYPHFRDIILIAYEGKDKERIEELLSESEYTLLECLIAANTIHLVLDASKQDERIEDFVVRALPLARSDPDYKNDAFLDRVEEYLFSNDMAGLRQLATFAFLGESRFDALQHYFFQLFSTFLEYWDFDFNSFTLKIKLYHHDFESVPLILSEPQLLFTEPKMEIADRLSAALFKLIKEIDNSLTPERRKLFHEILIGGIDTLAKQTAHRYLKNIS